MAKDNMKLSGNERIYGLDVYRAIAIVLVVLSHGAALAGDIFWFLPTVPLLSGIDGVELFFVLSGFLIGSILIKEIDKGEKFNLKSIAHFWKRRWFRTLPNYYLILLLNFLFIQYELKNGDLDQFGWSFIFFTHNLFDGFHSFFWESWSLSVEEWFYIILPLSIFGFRLFLSKKHTFLATILLLIIAPLLYRIYHAEVVYNTFNAYDIEVRKVVVMRLDTIVYGVFAAYIKYYFKDFWRLCRWPAFILGMAILYLGTTTNHSFELFYSRTFYFVIISIGAMFLLPLADSIKTYRVKWWGKTVTHISKISYSMYLINLGLVYGVIIKLNPPEAEADRWQMYILFWCVTVGASTLIYYFFERPMMKLRDRF